MADFIEEHIVGLALKLLAVKPSSDLDQAIKIL